MKKKLWIGCGIFVLSALVLFSAGSMNAAAKTDVSSGEETEQSAADSNVENEDSSEDEAEGISADSMSGLVKLIMEIAEKVKSIGAVESTASVSEEGVLYRIETSGGSNLGMVPIVNGSAVVLLDGTYASTYQGDYSPEEMSALSLKLDEETARAVSNGKISAWAFYRESGLRDFDIPAEVTAIEKFAFARSGLNSVVIPEGVTSIGYGAFYHCDSLSAVSIPDSVTTIEENAFSHTPWLKNWLAGGADDAESGEGAENQGVSEESDFLIVGDGVLLAYRGSEADPELPEGVKSVVPGAMGE